MLEKSATDLYQPTIMGILNVTPDSFSDGGQHHKLDDALRQAEQMINAGADILDIGGESTRPNAEPVSVAEELERVMPVITAIKANFPIPISVDTTKAVVMEEVLRAGVEMVNDVSAFTQEPESLAVVAEGDCSIVLMHRVGTPATMQSLAVYEDVVAEVFQYLKERIYAAEQRGITRERIYCDVGIGFGKTLEHNLSLLKNLDKFTDLGTKLLLGTSRKSFIPQIMGAEIDPQARLGGSLASITSGLKAKVDMFRVHDVYETKQFITTYLAAQKD